MLKKLLVACTASLCLLAQPATAGSGFNWQPRLGVQYQYMKLRPSAGWDTILPSKLNSIGFLAGAKVHEMLGFDLEYMMSGERKRVVTLANGTNVLGAAVGGADINTTTKLKLNYIGFDLNGYIPFNDNLNFLVGIGGFVGKASTNFDFSVANATTNAIGAVKGKSRIIPRITIGAEYMEKDVGVKLMYRWVNASKARMDVDTGVLTHNNAEKPFRDSGAIGFSVFMLV